MIVEILRETLDSLHTSNSEFQAARAEASNDMLKYMRVVFPIATKTQIIVLGNHGYTGQGEGIVLTWWRIIACYIWGLLCDFNFLCGKLYSRYRAFCSNAIHTSSTCVHMIFEKLIVLFTHFLPHQLAVSNRFGSD